MLLYITTGDPRDRETKPLSTIPDTVNELFYLAMREHARPAVVQHWSQEKWARDPDWRFDRQVIQVALFLMARYDITRQDRVAVFGPLRPLWVQVDFAVQGLQGTPVGLQETLTDDQLLRAIAESDPRVLFATDRKSAERLLGLRQGLGRERTIVTPYGKAEGDDRVVGIEFLWDQGRILDTPERAQNWRSLARKVDDSEVAGVHYSYGDPETLVREEFTHRDAMEFVRDRLTRFPPHADDVAYFEASTVTPITRKAYYALVGDGYTIVTIPGERDADALAELNPAKIVASSAWLEALGATLSAEGGSGRGRKARELLQEMVGDRLRWIEPASELSERLERQLLEAGLPLPAATVGGKTTT
jgi:hypothetical protein